MRNRLPRLEIILACVLLAGCGQEPTVFPTAVNRTREIAERQNGVADRGRKVVRPLTVEAHVVGSISTSTPIVIDIAVRATMPVEDAAISVTLPEVEIAREHGWASSPVSVGERIGPIMSLRHSMAASEVTMLRPTVSIPKPGYYRVVIRAVANPKSMPEDRESGDLVQTEVVRELWLLVTERGGRVTDKFDPSLLPPGVDDAQAGPFTPKVTAAAVTPFICICNSPCTPQPPGCGPASRLNITVTYYNPDYNAYLPFGEANYSVTIVGTTTVVASGTAGVTGGFSVPCPSGSQSYAITLFDRSTGRVNLLDPATGGTAKAYTYNTVQNPCATSFQLSIQLANDPIDWIYDNMRLAVDSSRAFFQRSRGEVTVNYAWKDTTDESFYSDGSDQITITAVTLYGEFGRFSTAHEYGHALAQASLNGDRSGGCPAVHFIDGSYTLLCALSEGWADYHAVAVRGTDAGSWYEGIRTNSFYHGGDGSIIEASVAAFLFDMTARANISDPFNGSDLALHYPGSYAADLMKTCFVTDENGETRLANGVDDIIHCAQRLHGLSLDSGLFPTRIDPPFGESDQATLPSNWNASAIGTLYRHKLFGL